MFSLIARVSFYPSLAYNVLMEKISSRDWYNHVDNQVILGAIPLRYKTRELVAQENVKAVVSLNEEYEVQYVTNSAEEWKQLGVDYIRFNVVDMFEAPSQDMLKEGVQFINRTIEQGGTVYVHCKAGRSRSATLVGCYLMQKNLWTPEQAISHLKSVRPHVIFTPHKVEALDLFYKNQIVS
uniref:Phosphatidylglycerophosphatase and protein-tyrosine phosphatase 1 n=1 Tax=Moina brachiata TaxID=675436 RepID=A0A4Y7NJC8_9CRUS|nr:EOG090X0GSS [Moina brachiata]SVE93341.1 EOG090X0GSS [Moina brachiata]